MLVLPKDDPLFVDLNTYYLRLDRLVEHLQGAVGTGALCFHAHGSEGILFFDEEGPVNAVLETREKRLAGAEAIASLTSDSDRMHFTVSGYRLPRDQIYYWANIDQAQTIFRDLTTEFTDLGGLIKKMGAERLTGYIEVHFAAGGQRAMIFLINGRLLGGAGSWCDDPSGAVSRQLEPEILERVKDSEASFSVHRLSAAKAPAGDGAGQPPAVSGKTLRMLAEFLSCFEETLSGQRRAPGGFQRLLRRKLLEKAERYPFLDPFAAEFEYRDGSIHFSGRASELELCQGVIGAVMELADELAVKGRFVKRLSDWSDRHAPQLKSLGFHR